MDGLNGQIIDPARLDFPKDSAFSKMFDLANFDPTKHESLIEQGKAASELFTAVVGGLRQEEFMSIESIRALMRLFWNLVGHLITPFAVCDGIKAMHFFAEHRNGKEFAAVICPPNWPSMMNDDPSMQVGAVIYIASQAQDYWNGMSVPFALIKKTTGQNPFLIRARAYEAEFLHKAGTMPNWTPNEYQKKVMEEFPNGLDSLAEEYIYPLREWDGPQS